MAWVTYTGAPPSTRADTGEPIQSKKSVTQAHPSMPSIPKYSIVPDTHAQNQTKRKSNRTNSQKELSPNSIDSTRVQLCTKRYASMLLDVFQLWFVSAWIWPSIQKDWWKLNRANCFFFYFKGEMSNQSVSDGAPLSLGLRSANGPKWMRFPPQEDVYIHLWVTTLSE